ncbi:uncharacterized protein Tco025E_00687 [Trypanosoma conorhini]|uniref:Uncharacterized protein n=1 Tax=Trypanosoma conorhini TaxID=83891 RepID=A0A3R7N871_9TRYP|nr:uncharacterized protein Tco025E_00687 [Trypanosoma conorhini]RNF27050.1 hypothetical protein Tco025E_00687 [Trypanosoma conorhini]
MGAVHMRLVGLSSIAASYSWSPTLARRFVAASRPAAPAAKFGSRARRPGSTSRVGGKAEQPQKVATHSSKAAASGPTMRRSRFYRVVQERGAGFAMYLYVFGESVTLAVLYALHSDLFSTGDVVTWLRFISLDSLVNLERWLEVGPIVAGLRLSPRLLLNYLVANALTYPLYATQLAFCAATFPLLRGVLSPVSYLLHARRASGRRGRAVPKAPSVGTKAEGRLTR